jgi:hypothetical protein
MSIAWTFAINVICHIWYMCVRASVPYGVKSFMNGITSAMNDPFLFIWDVLDLTIDV